MPGDVNRDGIVNGSDFAVLASYFGKTGCTWAQGDMTGDGAVNGSDFALLAGNFGKTATAAAAPAAAVVSTQPSAESPEDGLQRKPRRERQELRKGLRLLRRFADEHGLRAALRAAHRK